MKDENIIAAIKLADYVGDYDSEELGTTYRIIIKEGKLEMQHMRRGNLSLSWLWPDSFGTLDGYIGLIEFERNKEGNINGLIVNGNSRARNIRFIKRK